MGHASTQSPHPGQRSPKVDVNKPAQQPSAPNPAAHARSARHPCTPIKETPDLAGPDDHPPPSVIQRAAAGDPDAWRAITEHYMPRLFALAQSRLRDPEAAEEIAQSVIITVAEKLAAREYAEIGRFEPWLFRIAMNRIRDNRRRARNRRTFPLTPTDAQHRPALKDDDNAPHARTEKQDETRRARRSLRDAIEQLSPKDREIIEMRHMGQMSFKLIAAALGCPVGTALARHHRAIAKLRDILTDDTKQPGAGP